MTPIPKRDLQLLVIDDDPVISMLSAMMLRSIDRTATVSCFSKPAHEITDIISLLSDDKKRTIAFLDINIPDMNGWEVLDAIAEKTNKELPATTRIYLISSSISTSDKLRAYSNQLISGYFEKPLLHEDLSNLIFGDLVASMDGLWEENKPIRSTNETWII